jgi:hypothetical protein
MVILWAASGTVVGILSSPPGSGPVGYLAGACAGTIVLPWLGLVLGLLGGRCRETLVGGLCGAGCGFIGGIAIAPASVPAAVNLCLVIGGLAGATFPQISQLRRRITSRFLDPMAQSRPNEHPKIQVGGYTKVRFPSARS